MQTYSKGTIVEVVFPFEDTNEKKVRPALVIRDFGDNFLVAKITSKQKGREWDINIPKDDFNGLSVNSAIQLDKCIRLNKTNCAVLSPEALLMLCKWG